MANPPGVPSAIGIDAVEWSGEGADQLIVRVTGHWRRRRLPLRRRPQLVIEAHGQRHRFPALPEPPGLSDAPPGAWQMSFAVPSALAPHLGGRMWLAMGGVLVPLPTSESGGVSPDVEESLEVDPGLGELELRIERLQLERRSAEQRAHAEYSLRIELEEELAASRRHGGALEQLEGELAESEERIRELEREREVLRRRADEAEQLLELHAQPPPSRPSGVETEDVGPALRSTLAELRAELLALEEIAREERARRASAEARAAELERELARHIERAGRTYQALQSLRDEIDEMRLGSPRQIGGGAALGAGRLEPERFTDALRRLREAAQPIEPTEPDVVADVAAGTERAAVAPEAVGAAVVPEGVGAAAVPEGVGAAAAPEGVRAAAVPEGVGAAAVPEGVGAPAVPEAARAPARPWLHAVFRTLVARDPAGAGRLLLELLPAQALAYPAPVAYDLVLGPGACVQVGGAWARTQVVFADAPRPPEEVDFQVFGELPAVARLVVAGPLRGRLARRPARVRGRARSKFAALRDLAQASLTLTELHAAGVQLDPLLTMLVASLMIDRRWTVGERFTLAYREPSSEMAWMYLIVRDGAPLVVTRTPPQGGASVTIVCPPERLLPVLSGEDTSPDYVRGEQRWVERVREWLKLAQSGRIAL